jgi:hypothetical protein
MEDVLRFECGFEPESKLARAGIIPAGQQEKAYEVWVLPKNLRLARNVDPAE